MRRTRRAATALLVLLLAGTAQGAVTVQPGSDPTKFSMKGTLVTPDQVFDGEMTIEGDTITCAAVTCSTPAGATRISVTDGFIYPGFIDAHNHVAYNVLAKWNPPKLYESRSQWQGSTAYKAYKKPYDDLKSQGLFCEMVKYGEVKALLGGVTTIQGTSPNNQCFRTLIRNAENQNRLSGVPASHIRTYILDIAGFPDGVDWSKTKSFVVHIAEGKATHAPSRAEFQTLKQKGLLHAGTVVIHGMALSAQEFEEMAQVGAKLVWSPKSNLVLYDDTTAVDVALNKGIEISIGVDWNLTGSNHILDELRVASELNEERFNGAIHSGDWVKLVTANPARALALDQYIGRLAQGFKADITVLRKRAADPNASLLSNSLSDIQMVWVGGDLVYANKAIMDKVKPGLCEALTVKGSRKKVCVSAPQDPGANREETLAEIESKLKAVYPALSPLAQ
jgi:cytosine/adenosine deaminase-related metal-dependent hydrolase